jgi:hypothetical protein
MVIDSLAESSEPAAGLSNGPLVDRGLSASILGVRDLEDHLGELPTDGRIFLVVDLPVSAAIDTVLLPATAFMKPRRPSQGFAACFRWVKKR